MTPDPKCPNLVPGHTLACQIADLTRAVNYHKRNGRPLILPATGRFTGVRYLAFSTTSTSRQRLLADSGRVSISSTRSPTPAELASSCALTLVV
jgi:hypothetical protein